MSKTTFKRRPPGDAYYAFKQDGEMDSNDPDFMLHKHVKKIVQLYKEKKIGTQPGLYLTNIFHDAWCSLYKVGYCDCDPDIRLELMQ